MKQLQSCVLTSTGRKHLSIQVLMLHATLHTILSHFVAHAPLSEHAPLLEYRRTEVYCNIYNTDTPAFSINSQNALFSARTHAPKSMIIQYRECNIWQIHEKNVPWKLPELEARLLITAPTEGISVILCSHEDAVNSHSDFTVTIGGIE